MSKIKVVVNGVGTVGKRIAHAIKLQDDMELVAISDVAPTTFLKTVLEPGGPLYGTDLYASTDWGLENLRKAGMYVNGLLEDLLRNGAVDVVVDATPAGVGAKNKPLYEKYGVKAIFQGGEEAEVAEISFNAVANYEDAIGKNYIRVVSCNTTSLCRTLWHLDKAFGVEEVFAALARRGADPWEDKKGPINAIVPSLSFPSHHAIDVQTVMPWINIKSLAVVVPTTLAHVHMVHVKTKSSVKKEDVMNVFDYATRIIMVNGKEGYTSTAKIIEKFRDLLRPRYDVYEVVIWKETIGVENNNIYWIHAVHQEAIIIPENIDAIRACMGFEDKWKSIEKTNKSLGVRDY